MRAAQLKDDRYLAEVELQLEKQRREATAAYRPQMEHFSPEVEAIYDLSDDIRLLIGAMTKSELAFRQRPESPADRIEARKREISRNRNAEIRGEVD